MNRQQRRASARTAPKLDAAEGRAMVAMASQIAALSPEGRAIACEASAVRLSSMDLTPGERAGAERRIATIRMLVGAIDDAKRGGR